VTARARPGVTVDVGMPLLADAVRREGAEVVVTPWDDTAVSWAGFHLVVIRSPWDYTWRTDEFLAWVDRCAAATRLVNPPGIIRWNADKAYLRELAEDGIPVVPTRYLAPGDPIELPSDGDFVVKPAVGAGSRNAARYRRGRRDEAAAHVARMHAERKTALIQPYLHHIDTVGERGLVFIAGAFLHAIRKNAVLTADLRYDQPRDPNPGAVPCTPTGTELDLARRALAAVPHADGLFYARVDMISSPGHEPVVTELELIEPTLYLDIHSGSAATVARAINRLATVRW
jgi:glutathione synthase/RimK-type ligase-like ATP-grasp enzyme